jgi:adenylate cyclase
MRLFRQIRSRFSFLRKYHFRWVLIIAVSWTIFDLIWIRFFHFSLTSKIEDPLQYVSTAAILLRGVIVFLMSSLMGYLLIFKLRQLFRDVSLLSSLVIKTTILLLASVFMNFLLHVTYSVFILGLPAPEALGNFFRDATSTIWLAHHSLGWIVLFLITQFTIEFYEKYSPGVFWDIMIGRYIRPKVQKRIIMFLDLKDSTPIAEQLQSDTYFSFIRDFIYYVSIALLEYHGRIYQYVGDEIVVSWQYSPENTENCINALMLAARLLKHNSSYFRKRYGFIPEFKAGIHAGEVTVGEIGLIKKDIAMSGDIMNTAARIRTACTELKQNCLVSKEFFGNIEKSWPVVSLGAVDLKGKSESMELYAIKI